MNEVNPEILYDLYQLRAQALQQEAARYRITSHRQQWINGWRRYGSALSAFMMKGALLLTGQIEKPVEGCC